MTVRSIVFGAAALAFVAVIAPNASAADEPLEVHYPPSSVRIPVILGGLGVFGSAYGLGVAVSRNAPDVPGSKALVVPVAGPWIALGQNACAPTNPDCGGLLYLRGFLLALEGVIQVGGLGLVAQGILMKTEAGPAKSKSGFLEVKHGDFSLQPIPLTSKQMNGVGFVGTF